MKLRSVLTLIACLGTVSGSLLFAQPAPAPGAWRTIYSKRVFLGNYEAGWVGGGASILRQPLTMPEGANKARVWFRSLRDQETQLDHVSLAPGADAAGVTDGRFFPVTFAGAPTLKIDAKAAEFASDEVTVPAKAGVWYLQQRYTSAKFLYTQDNDGVYRIGAPEQINPALGSFIKGSALGNVSRIDVFTTSPKKVIACYGDSITQGQGATPGSGNRYPDLLSKKLGRPVLNLGVNGDLAKHARGLPLMLRNLEGVDTVVFMIGINDINTGSLPSAQDYAENITALADNLKVEGKRFYLGTIPPAGGYPKYDDSPEKEDLRQAVNAWIRSSAISDGIIDFDAALANPIDSRRMRADCQSDWLHPNDAGYQRMAEAAALVVK